jgi:hypothetical protein
MALGYELHDRRFESRQGLGIFLFTTASRPVLGPTQPRIQWIPRALSLGVKRLGGEANNWPPSSVEFNNAWSYTSTPQYAFLAWWSVKAQGQLLYDLYRCRDIPVSIVTMLQVGAGNFSPHHRDHVGWFRAHLVSYPKGIGGCFPGVKRTGRETNHSPPSSGEVKNASSYTSAFLYVFMAWYLVKQRDNFTFSTVCTERCMLLEEGSANEVNCYKDHHWTDSSQHKVINDLYIYLSMCKTIVILIYDVSFIHCFCV